MGLTFAHWSVVTPGCKHFGHSLTADGFTALKYIVLFTTELHHTANAIQTYADISTQRVRAAEKTTKKKSCQLANKYSLKICFQI